MATQREEVEPDFLRMDGPSGSDHTNRRAWQRTKYGMAEPECRPAEDYRGR